VAVATGALFNRTQQFANQVLFGASVENDRQMQFTADPVLGTPQTYDYYRAFARDPELFNTCDEEPKFPVYLKKKHCKQWFYIPCESGPVFQQLVLKTSLMLGQESPPPVFWSTQILSATEHITQISGSRYVYDFEFSEPIPNVDDEAFMIVKTNQCPIDKVNIPLSRHPKASMNDPFVQQMRFIQDQSLQSSSNLCIADLVGTTVKVYSASHPKLTEQTWESLRLKAALDAYNQFRVPSR
jgi:hypothetical protein